MGTCVDVATPAELATVLEDQQKGKAVTPRLLGEAWNTWGRHAELWGSSHAVLRGSSHAVLWESSHAVLWESSHAVLWESSHAVLWESSHAVLWESSHAVLWGSSHAELWGSSHAELWGSSHAELWGSSHAELWGSAVVHAWGRNRVRSHSPYAVTMQMHGAEVDHEGGILVVVPPITTAEDWCAWYGIPVTDGVAVLFKAVRDNYRSAHGFLYAPGTSPEAPDWDGGKAECGGGLHLAADPLSGKHSRFGDSAATRFIACPVRLEDLRPPRVGDEYPQKVKARRLCGPVVEVDAEGRPLDAV